MDDQTFMRIALFIPSVNETLSRIAHRRDREDSIKLATEAGFDDLDEYILDCHRKNPIYPARRYLECVNEYGAGRPLCIRQKEHWLELKAMQKNGNKLDWNEEEVHKMLKEDAIEAGYIEGHFFKKNPSYLEYTAREYEKCIAEHGVGAENTWCKYKKRVWLKAKAFQNAD